MGAYYSVIRYLPDMIRGEQINIGVVVWDDNTIFFKFLENWERFAVFSGNACTIEVITEIIQELQRMTAEQIIKAAEKWKNSIQFSYPSYSLLGCKNLLDEVTIRFLVNKEVVNHPSLICIEK
jgi:hypothetical protein